MELALTSCGAVFLMANSLRGKQVAIGKLPLPSLANLLRIQSRSASLEGQQRGQNTSERKKDRREDVVEFYGAV